MITTETNTHETEQHLFTEQDVFNYVEASTGQRFLNYLIDALVMQYGLGIVSGYLLARLVVAISPEAAYVARSESFDILASYYLLAIFNYLIYYTFCEKLFKGYTLGKLITGTRAIREDGQELNFKDAFLRSLSRLVPFEPFSIWGGNGIWHDSWTKTMVIKSR